MVRICCAVDFGGDAVEVPPDEAATSAVDQEVGDVLAKEAFSGLSRDDVVAAREINKVKSPMLKARNRPEGWKISLETDKDLWTRLQTPNLMSLLMKRIWKLLLMVLQARNESSSMKVSWR